MEGGRWTLCLIVRNDFPKRNLAGGHKEEDFHLLDDLHSGFLCKRSLSHAQIILVRLRFAALNLGESIFDDNRI